MAHPHDVDPIIEQLERHIARELDELTREFHRGKFKEASEHWWERNDDICTASHAIGVRCERIEKLQRYVDTLTRQRVKLIRTQYGALHEVVIASTVIEN